MARLVHPGHGLKITEQSNNNTKFHGHEKSSGKDDYSSAQLWAKSSYSRHI